MIHPLTEETAAAERRRLLNHWHDHKRAMQAAKRALDRLEAECARHGIRLIREPMQTRQGEHREPQRPDHR